MGLGPLISPLTAADSPACAAIFSGKAAQHSRIITVRNVVYLLGKGVLALGRHLTSMEHVHELLYECVPCSDGKRRSFSAKPVIYNKGFGAGDW